MISFALPPGLEATAPPEARGLARDGVRLLVASRTGRTHRRFRDLPELLTPGDLVVVNTSATLPAAVDAPAGPVHVSSPLDDGSWVVEPRRPDNSGPRDDVRARDRLALPGGVTLELVAAYPDPTVTTSRLWRARAEPSESAEGYLKRHGRPIGYAYLTGRFPLAASQNVYATEPGSAENASAGRPFTAPLLVALMARGVVVAPVVLHAGVSSPELHEPPIPERYDVPAATARLVNATRSAGGRVIAVGTTVVRALETVAGPHGDVRSGRGWTNLILRPQRPARVVTGLVTGLHPPEASHLMLLEAVAGTDLVATAYDAALAQRYLWHEFGDSMLLLP